MWSFWIKVKLGRSSWRMPFSQPRTDKVFVILSPSNFRLLVNYIYDSLNPRLISDRWNARIVWSEVKYRAFQSYISALYIYFFYLHIKAHLCPLTLKAWITRLQRQHSFVWCYSAMSHHISRLCCRPITFGYLTAIPSWLGTVPPHPLTFLALCRQPVMSRHCSILCPHEEF